MKDLLDVQLLTPKDSDYPDQFRTLFQPPLELYALGDLSPLTAQPRLSIVGTRMVSPYGKDVTHSLATSVAKKGVTIVSGMALGVDGLSHRAALEAGGYTVAILAGGFHVFHPRNHTHLAHQILEQGGAIISEYPPGEPALKHQFIERNRLVAALGDALLITEAAQKSGTMHTVEFALGQGKTVLAVPGNINSQTSKGTNKLIKEGAIPVTEVNDILYALGIEAGSQQRLPIGDTPEENAILYLLNRGVSESNALQAISELSPSRFGQTLTMLEITGKIRSLGGGHWAIR